MADAEDVIDEILAAGGNGELGFAMAGEELAPSAEADGAAAEIGEEAGDALGCKWLPDVGKGGNAGVSESMDRVYLVLLD